MLRIYDVMIEALKDMRPAVRALEAHDKALAQQIKNAASSVVLNIAEGSGNRGGTRRARYDSALGSARETRACLDVGAALGYLTLDNELRCKLDVVIGTLVKLLR